VLEPYDEAEDFTDIPSVLNYPLAVVAPVVPQRTTSLTTDQKHFLATPEQGPDTARRIAGSKGTVLPAQVSPQSKVTLRARMGLDESKIDCTPMVPVKENIEEFEKLIAM